MSKIATITVTWREDGSNLLRANCPECGKRQRLSFDNEGSWSGEELSPFECGSCGEELTIAVIPTDKAIDTGD